MDALINSLGLKVSNQLISLTSRESAQPQHLKPLQPRFQSINFPNE